MKKSNRALLLTIQFVLEFQKLFAQNVSYRLILESGLELARPLEVELMLELDPDLDEDLDEERPLERFSEDSVGDTSRDPLLLQMMSWINFCHNESLVKLFSPACAGISNRWQQCSQLPEERSHLRISLSGGRTPQRRALPGLCTERGGSSIETCDFRSLVENVFVFFAAAPGGEHVPDPFPCL